MTSYGKNVSTVRWNAGNFFAILLSVTFRKAGVFMEIYVNSDLSLFLVVFYCTPCSDNTVALMAIPTENRK